MLKTILEKASDCPKQWHSEETFLLFLDTFLCKILDTLYAYMTAADAIAGSSQQTRHFEAAAPPPTEYFFLKNSDLKLKKKIRCNSLNPPFFSSAVTSDCELHILKRRNCVKLLQWCKGENMKRTNLFRKGKIVFYMHKLMSLI